MDCELDPDNAPPLSALLTISASLIPPPQTGPSAEDVKKVVADYHVREARKAIEAKESGKTDKDSKDKDNKAKDDKEKEKDKDKEQDEDKSKDSPAPTIPSIPIAAPAPSHRRFALHRQMYDMRKNEIKRKEQGVKAREVGKGLPQVPRGGF